MATQKLRINYAAKKHMVVNFVLYDYHVEDKFLLVNKYILLSLPLKMERV